MDHKQYTHAYQTILGYSIRSFIHESTIDADAYDHIYDRDRFREFIIDNYRLRAENDKIYISNIRRDYQFTFNNPKDHDVLWMIDCMTGTFEVSHNRIIDIVRKIKLKELEI